MNNRESELNGNYISNEQSFSGHQLMTTMRGKTTPRILLLRTNSFAEVLAGWSFVSELKEHIPGCHFTTLVEEQSEAESLVMLDDRVETTVKLSEVHKRSPASLKRLLRQQKCDCSIATFFVETPKRQPQRLFALLLSSGKKFIYINHTYIPLSSSKGLLILAQAARSFLQNRALKRLATLKKKAMVHSAIDISQLPIKRILWMRPDYLGDVILSLPTLKVLKKYFPNAEIDAVVLNSSSAILKNNSEISHVWKIDFADFAAIPTPRRQFKRMTQKMKERHYDLALDFLGSDSVRQLAYQLQIPCRAGFSEYADEEFSTDCSYMLTHSVRFSRSFKHDSQKRLDLLRGIGFAAPEIGPEINVTSESRNLVEKKIKNMGISKPFAVIHPCTSSVTRNWSIERFARVADYLAQNCPFEVLFTGTSADSAYIEEIIQCTRHKKDMFNGAEKFKIEELSALFKEAQLMVTVDTGPMHIAAAVQTPIVALILPFFASSYPFRQYDSTLIPILPKSGLGSRCPSGALLESIRPEDVFEAIDAKMHESLIVDRLKIFAKYCE